MARGAGVVRVLALATEWLPAHGGVSTFNRQLCRALAAAGAEVYCSLPAEPTTAESVDAEACGVRLVTPPLLSGASHLEILARRPRLPDGVVPDLVLGHGRVTGRPAHILVQDHYRTAARFHVVHTRPDELEWHKTDRHDDPAERAEDRTREERDLLGQATRVIAVGPRIAETLPRDLPDGGRRLLRVDPGFDDPDQPDAPKLVPRPGPPRILVVGRLEDAPVKGVDIAARAVGHALGSGALGEDTRVELLLRGSRRGDGAELRRQVLGWAGPLPLGMLDTSIRNYSTDADWLRQERDSASLILMPSRAEAFGLVGVEAIAAGIPLLAAGHSGLGALLKQLCPEAARRMLLPLYDDPARDTPAWSQAIARVLGSTNAFAEADALRRTVRAARTWADAARTVLDAFEAATEPATAPPAVPSVAPQPVAPQPASPQPVRRPANGVAPGSFYRQSILQIAGGGCEGREEELAAMADFATGDGPGWWRWLAPAWAGKTTVMARFALQPPPGVCVVAFFITARLAGQNDRAAFCQIVQRQLYALIGEEEPPVTEQTRDSQLLHALERAAALCAARGERLVLLVDGLDEDRGVTAGPDAHSIAALLPAEPPHGARVLVAGRPHPPIPDDVAPGHPLRSARIDHALSPSPHAMAARAQVERDLYRLYQGGGLSRGLVGLVAAAGGGLSAADLAHLSTADTTPRLVERTLGTSGGRAFITRPPTWQRPDAPNVYLLAHEDIQQAALDLITRSEIARHRDRLHAWADAHRSAGWPDDTPEYLLRGYPGLLRASADVDRLSALACDPARHERLWRVSGADRAALGEIDAAFDLLLAAGSTTEADLATALRLAVHRENLHRVVANTPDELVTAWAQLGHSDRAVAMALAHPSVEAKVTRLDAVAARLIAGSDVTAARDVLDEALALAETLVDPTARERVIGNLAVTFARSGDHRRATELARTSDSPHMRERMLGAVAIAVAEAGLPDQAADLARLVDSPDWRIDALTGLADALAKAGRRQDASDLAEEAVRLAGSLTDGYSQTEALTGLADLLRRIGDTGRAGDLIEQALVLARTATKPYLRGMALTQVAVAYAGAGRFQRAIDVARSIPGPDEEAEALTEVARRIAETGHHQRALDLARTVADPVTRNAALADIAKTLAGAGRHPLAVEVVRSIADHRWHAQTLADVAGALAGAGLHAEAVSVADTVANPHQKIRALALVSAGLAGAGRPGRAVDLAQQATDLAHSIRRPSRTVRDLLEIADALQASGARQRATDLRCQAAEQANTLSDPFGRGQVLAQVCAALADSDRHQQAIDLVDTIPHPFHRHQALVAIATALAMAGRFQSAARLIQAPGDPIARSNTLRSITGELAELGHPRAAVELVDTVTDPYVKVRALVDIAGVLVRTGDHRAAAVTEQAVEVAHTIGDPTLRADALTEVSAVLGEADGHRRAAELARTVAPLDRDTALAAMANVLAGAGRHLMAMGLADSDEESDRHALTVTLAAVALVTAGHLGPAAALVDSLPDDDRRNHATALVAMAGAATGHQRQAVEIARNLADQAARARTLVELADAVHPSDGALARRLLLEALSLAPWPVSASVLGKVAPAVVAAETAWFPSPDQWDGPES